MIPFGLAYVAFNITTDTVYYGWLFSAILYFAVGVVLCRALIIYKENRNDIHIRMMSMLQIICPILFLVCLYFGRLRFVTVIITCFVFSLIEGGLSKLLSLKIFQKMGKMSYTFYMMHWCVFSFSTFLRIEYPNLTDTSLKYKGYVVLTWIILFVISYLFYRFVEEPCCQLMKKCISGRECKNI